MKLGSYSAVSYLTSLNLCFLISRIGEIIVPTSQFYKDSMKPYDRALAQCLAYNNNKKIPLVVAIIINNKKWKFTNGYIESALNKCMY